MWRPLQVPSVPCPGSSLPFSPSPTAPQGPVWRPHLTFGRGNLLVSGSPGPEEERHKSLEIQSPNDGGVGEGSLSIIMGAATL